MSIDAFKSYYEDGKNKLEERINKFNEELVKEDNKFLRENLEYFKNLNSNGKLVRGTLVNLGYNLLKDGDYSYDLALAYEVFQTSILIHDDIIDNDSKRRGVETIHYINDNKYKKYSDESKHLGDSIAICIGNYGLYKANEMISKSYENDQMLGKVLNCFNDTVLKTAKGELLDVILPFESKYVGVDNQLLEETIMNIYDLKTANYTIIGPMSVGLILAGADEAYLKDIKLFGEKVGLAFQIQDDLLGIYSEQTGKVVGSDIREFKQTILYAHAMSTNYKDELLKVYGKNVDEDVLEKTRNLFKESGSYDYAVDKMNGLYDEAITMLDSFEWIEESKKEILRGFVEYLRTRNK